MTIQYLVDRRPICSWIRHRRISYRWTWRHCRSAAYTNTQCTRFPISTFSHSSISIILGGLLDCTSLSSVRFPVSKIFPFICQTTRNTRVHTCRLLKKASMLCCRAHWRVWVSITPLKSDQRFCCHCQSKWTTGDAIEAASGWWESTAFHFPPSPYVPRQRWWRELSSHAAFTLQPDAF